MDALDEVHNDKEGGEENVDADEREGNKEYNHHTDSDPNEYPDDDQDNQSRSQTYVEERMKRLNLNEKSQEEFDSKTLSDAQNILNAQQQMMMDRTEQRFNPRQIQPMNEEFDDPYQQYQEYHQPPPQENMNDENSENARNKMMIMQYESVLQSVNREFQKLLDKNKETEDELNIFKMKFEQLQRAYENEVNSNAINSGIISS